MSCVWQPHTATFTSSGKTSPSVMPACLAFQEPQPTGGRAKERLGALGRCGRGLGHSWNVGFNRPGGERKAWRWGAGGDDRHPGSSGLPSKKSVGFPGGSDSKASACNAGGQEFSSLSFPSFKEKQHLSEGRICSEPQKQT